LVLLTTLRFHAGTQIMQMSTAHIPLTLVEGSALVNPVTRPWDTDTITNLETVGIHVDEVIEETVARPATAEEIRDLQLRPGAPVFLMARTMLTSGKPVETCDIVMPTDRYLLSYRFSVNPNDDD
jgi:DNA-binding GntR family transcriptional regulator